MRLRRPNTIELVLVAVASLLLVGSAYLFWSSREVMAEQANLETQVARREAEARRAQDAQQQVERLREELAKLEAQLALPPGLSFPKTVPGVEATQLVITALGKSSLEMGNFSFLGASPSRVGTRDYIAHRFTLKAKGQLSQMSPFLRGIEEGGFATLVVKNIAVTPTADKTAWELSAEITIYAQPS